MTEWAEETRSGLRYRHCYPAGHERFGTCGHYIETREDTVETGLCNTTFHQPKFIGRRDDVTKAEMAAFIRHQPRCRNCLEHGNSYLFPAWYDISQAQADRVADLYNAYGDTTRRTGFHANGDHWLVIALATAPNAAGDEYVHGDLNLDTMEAEFHWMTEAPHPDELTPSGEYRFETDKFDLSTARGWVQLNDYHRPDAPMPLTGSAI